MASSPKLPAFFFLLLAALAAAAAPARAAQEYCRDSLDGLMDCQSFMYGGALPPSAVCCAAYSAAFNADPFCLCYVADGTYGRATGYNVNVTRALQIPASCGQAAPPVELCNMQGLVLPPYAPKGSPAAAAAAAPTAQPPSAGSVAPPSFTSPQPPPPTSHARRDSSLELIIVLAAMAVAVAVL
ncbi:non-specific lipid transfer protein GPI-anchored 19-like [Phragmites australis]|uniref:non-specific lipid transfer protein GPI-anchored 19-like n=1 Tax=Phragmites australis TaxID=29695 RepID=UPI002D7927FC|nr:non-specific lipid transfer protein GPI-anchored 19-like [Phragmites australis]